MKSLFNRFTLASALLFSTFTTVAEPQAIYLQKGSKQITVFGTMHVAKPDFYPLPKPVTASLKSSDALAVEIDITDPKVMSETMQLMAVSMKNSNAKGLDKTRLNQLEALIDPTAAAAFASLPLPLAAMSITIIRAEQLGYTEPAVDSVLISRAKSQSKPVLSLEKPAEQIEPLINIPDSESLALFDSAIADKGIEEIQQTESLWKTGDIQIAQQLIKQGKTEAPQLFQSLVTDRNRTMAKRIAKLNQQYPRLFVAIGALHLYGNNNVIQRLQQQGYQRIKQ